MVTNSCSQQWAGAEPCRLLHRLFIKVRTWLYCLVTKPSFSVILHNSNGTPVWPDASVTSLSCELYFCWFHWSSDFKSNVHSLSNVVPFLQTTKDINIEKSNLVLGNCTGTKREFPKTTFKIATACPDGDAWSWWTVLATASLLKITFKKHVGEDMG